MNFISQAFGSVYKPALGQNEPYCNVTEVYGSPDKRKKIEQQTTQSMTFGLP